MQMYSVSARSLYRISPWYRLKPLIFRKTDRPGPGCPCPWRRQPGWPGVSCTIRPLSRMLAGPGLWQPWLTGAIIISLRSPPTQRATQSDTATVNNHHVRLQSSWPGQPELVRRIRKYSQQAVLGMDIFSGSKVVVGDCKDVFVLHPAECWCRTLRTTNTLLAPRTYPLVVWTFN